MYDNIALRLRLSPEELERDSLRLFLNHRLRLVESQLLGLARRYGVRTVAELDHLEAERDALLDSLKELA